MKNIDALKIRIELREKLEKGMTFDLIFSQPGFLDKFTQFLETRVGENWLESNAGKDYRRWQKS